MSRQVLLVLVSLLLGVLAYLFGASVAWKAIAEKAPTILAVFIAAVFVRLARGVPTFPFDKIPNESSRIVLRAVDHLRGVYRLALSSYIITLIYCMFYEAQIENIRSGTVKAVLSAALCTLFAWAIAVAYLLFRTDIAVMKAQSDAFHVVVDQSETKSAESTVNVVRQNLERLD